MSENNDQPFVDRLLKILNHRVLVGPLISFCLVLLLLIGTGSLIFIIADFNAELNGLEKTLGQVCQKHSVVLISVAA